MTFGICFQLPQAGQDLLQGGLISKRLSAHPAQDGTQFGIDPTSPLPQLFSNIPQHAGSGNGGTELARLRIDQAKLLIHLPRQSRKLIALGQLRLGFGVQVFPDG